MEDLVEDILDIFGPNEWIAAYNTAENVTAQAKATQAEAVYAEA